MSGRAVMNTDSKSRESRTHAARTLSSAENGVFYVKPITFSSVRAYTHARARIYIYRVTIYLQRTCVRVCARMSVRVCPRRTKYIVFRDSFWKKKKRSNKNADIYVIYVYIPTCTGMRISTRDMRLIYTSHMSAPSSLPCGGDL